MSIPILPDIKGDSTLPINPNNGNDKIHIDIPDWIKNVPTPPFSPHAPYPEQIWYDKDSGIDSGVIKIDAHKQEDVRYATSISCTEDTGCMTTVRNPNDSVTYTGDFRDVQTSFNDK